MADHPPLSPPAALSLTLAIIVSSTAPLVLLDGDFRIIACSDSFFRTFRLDPAKAAARLLFELGEGEWDVPQLRSLLLATVTGQAEIGAYEFDLERAHQKPRRVVLNAHRLEYENSRAVRLLLSATDVTDARLAERVKDDLLREKGVLLQEIQHRVANSLQIIAAILMQSARNVSSAETKSHLRDAHERVMSIASVQRQLAATGGGEVQLKTYFTQLCDSIGASMIRDHNQITLAVTADDTSTKADVSVSLGLIVTELVINALKHAFPDRRHGSIKVDYGGDGSNWSLSVADDGVGMPANGVLAKSGLGTTIIGSLAKQLHAHVEVSENDPGTKVSIVHGEVDEKEVGEDLMAV